MTSWGFKEGSVPDNFLPRSPGILSLPGNQLWCLQVTVKFLEVDPTNNYCLFRPKPDLAYSSVPQTSIVQKLSIMHQWVTPLHWTTCSLITMNTGTAILVSPTPSSYCTKSVGITNNCTCESSLKHACSKKGKHESIHFWAIFKEL